MYPFWNLLGPRPSEIGPRPALATGRSLPEHDDDRALAEESAMGPGSVGRAAKMISIDAIRSREQLVQALQKLKQAVYG